MWSCQRVFCWSCHMLKPSHKNWVCVHLWSWPAPAHTHVNMCRNPHTHTHMVLIFLLYHPKGNWWEGLFIVIWHMFQTNKSEKSHRNWLKRPTEIKCWTGLWDRVIKGPSMWSSNYLLKDLLKSPPWLSQHALHNRSILRIYCLQVAHERQGQVLHHNAFTLAL